MNERARIAEVAFTVNGEARRVAVSPATRLSDVLRDELALAGTKVGCNAGDCGACTVLLDGRQVCACLVALGQVEGRAVTTVEGLAAGGKLDRLQRAFVAHGAAQCGICTPGMLMAATDLLERNPRPTDSEALDALGGVLCRCTGYRKIVEAVLAAATGEAVLAEVPPGAAVGARAPKTDGVAKVMGTEIYAADRAPADALWLRTIRSPYAKARFTLGDFAPLRARHAGLVDVITARDVPVNSFGIFPDVKDQPVLADGRVRFRGEAVLCLVGEQRAVLAIGDDEIPIRWTEETPQTAIDDALDEHAGADPRGESGQRADPRPGGEGRRRDGDRCRGTRGRRRVHDELRRACVHRTGGGLRRADRRSRSGSSPARRRRTWTGTRPRASSGSSRNAFTSCRPPSAADSAASWTSRCSRCSRSRRGSSAGRYGRSTRDRSRWPRRRSAIRRGCARASPATARGAWWLPIFPATSTPAPTPRGATRSRTASRSTRPARTSCRTFGRSRAPSTPTVRSPALSAASAYRSRRSCTRRCSTSWPRRPGSTRWSSGIGTRSGPDRRPRRGRS